MGLSFAFFTLLLISFGVTSFFLADSKKQKLMERRIKAVLPSGDALIAGDSAEHQLLKADPEGNFSALNILLQNFHIAKSLKTKIMQADSDTSPAMLLVTAAVLAVIGFVGVSIFVKLLILQVAVGAILGYVPLGLLSLKRSRRIKAFNGALPDAIDMMGRALRAGHSMTASINIVAEQSIEPVRSEFSEVFKQQNFGLPLRDAMMQMLDRVPSQDLRVVVTGMLVQKETGGNLAEILDRTAHTIRERLKIQGEIKTHTAQGRMTGWILCMLPVVMLAVINVINPGYSKMLVDTQIGRTLSYTGVALLIIGGLIIRQIINGIEV